MNPAALQVHQKEVKPGGTIICNANAFTPKNLKLAGYETNPLEDKTLEDYFTVYAIEMGKMVSLACEGLDLSSKIVDRSTGEISYGKVPPYSVVVPGSLPNKKIQMVPHFIVL